MHTAPHPNTPVHTGTLLAPTDHRWPAGSMCAYTGWEPHVDQLTDVPAGCACAVCAAWCGLCMRRRQGHAKAWAAGPEAARTGDPLCGDIVTLEHAGELLLCIHDPGRTRTCNPRLRGPMPYPLGRGATWASLRQKPGNSFDLLPVQCYPDR